MGVMWPYAKECWQPPEAEKRKEQILLQSLQRECVHAHTLLQAG